MKSKINIIQLKIDKIYNNKYIRNICKGIVNV